MSSTPDGLRPGGAAPFNLSTDISSYQGISGIRLDKGSGFLVGVFLPSTAPADPARLLFTDDGAAGLLDVAFTSPSLVLDQTFFIGDGLTGSGSGAPQNFVVPGGAPGQYQDSGGSVMASFQVLAPVPEAPSVVSFSLLLGFGTLAVRRREAARRISGVINPAS